MAEKKLKREAKPKRERLKKRVRKSTEHQEAPIYVQVSEGGRKYETWPSVKMKMRKPWRKPDPREICSTIPGSVVSLFVKEGDTVEKEQQLMVFEAMKMHNVIRAPFSGTVEQVLVKPGDKLPRGVVMMVICFSETEETAAEPVSQNAYYEDF